MKKGLFGSLAVLTFCLSQNGMGSNSTTEETIEETNKVKYSPIKQSLLEEKEIEIKDNLFSSPEKIKRDDLSLIIETVNRVQTFLGEQKENFKNFKNLKKEDLQEIAKTSSVVLMKEFRNNPLAFMKEIQGRKNIIKKDPAFTIEKIGEPLYKQTLAGINIVYDIFESFDD